MTEKDLQTLLRTIGRFVAARLSPLDVRIRALEQYQGQWKYCGVWDQNQKYERNNFVTHSGSLFICYFINFSLAPARRSR